MGTVSTKIVKIARRVLFHTWIGKTRLASRITAFLFELSAPDLTRPVLFRDVRLYLDPADRSYVPAVVAGYYEAKELEIFEELVTHASVLFDLGANIGIYSVTGCLRAPALRSYAFEPVAENQAILRRNIAANHLEDRISVEPVAVSDRTGKARIHLGFSGNHSLENVQGGDSREIETVSLDEFIAATGVSPDLMKVDVEGHEAAVVDGARRLLADHAPTTFMEYTPGAQHDLESLIDRLRSAFSTWFVVDEIAGKVREVSPGDLDRRKAYNLILTSNARHAEEIGRFVAL